MPKVRVIGTNGVATALVATNGSAPNSVVMRDANGNFSVGTVSGSFSGSFTGTMTGTAARANALATGRMIWGNYFDGTADIPYSAVVTAGSMVGTAYRANAIATPRRIYGNFFDGTADLTQILSSIYGGTGNGFTKFTGATSSEKTYTLPDASVTLLYQNGPLGTPSSGALTNCSFPTFNQNTTGSAAALSSFRNIAMLGDGTWNVNFNGTSNVTGTMTLATVNSTSGTFGGYSTGFPSFRVNAKGLVTEAFNNPFSGVVTVGTLTAGQTGTGFTVDVSKSTIKGTIPAASISTNATARSMGVSIDGNGAVVTTGQKGYVVCRFSGTITGWSVSSKNASASAVFDVWKIAGPTAGQQNVAPTVANTIINTGAGGVKPTLTASQFASSTNVNNWTPYVAAGDIFGWNVDSNSVATQLTLELGIVPD